MLLIALTGGIGAGKSSAGSLLARLGAVHISADQLAREILERGEVGFDEVVAHFGDQILTAGAIDRNKLASLVFQDPKKRSSPLFGQKFVCQSRYPGELNAFRTRVGRCRNDRDIQHNAVPSQDLC